MSTNKYWKCYFGCEIEGVLHRFPNPRHNEERFNLWLKALGTDMQNSDPFYIYNNLRLCDKHFEVCYHTPSKKLTRNAVPTINIESVEMGHGLLKDSQLNYEMNVDTATTSKSLEQDSPTTSKNFSQQPAPKEKRQNQKYICKLKAKLKKLSQEKRTQLLKIKCAKNLSFSKQFLMKMDKFPEPIKTFTKLQLKGKNKPRGRRYTTEEKALALAIFKQSPKAYSFMKNLFILPSKRILQNNLSKILLEPFINTNIFEHLQRTVQRLPAEKKLCTLIFDEVALEAGLNFIKGQIIGFENFGFKNSSQIADHALVFMIKSIKGKYKQPICFTFCKSCTKKEDLKRIIKQLILEIHKTGLKVITTICDQSPTNMSVIKSLKEDTKANYLRKGLEYNSNAYEVEENKIFHLFDTPHLLKGIRNNLLKKDALFVEDGIEKVAKWEHLKMLLEKDVGDLEIRLVNKLTESHVAEKKIPKMKVKYSRGAQEGIFGFTRARQIKIWGIFCILLSTAMVTKSFYIGHNILPEECQDTSRFLLLFDKLFDSFNGHSYSGSPKELAGCLKHNSPHFTFWNKVLPILSSIKFKSITKKTDGSETIKLENVPSVSNWIENIQTFKEMWGILKTNHKIFNLITHNFNQDPLENFFCCIRSNGVRNTNPTCAQFINAYKTLLVNNLCSPHSVNANCEADNSKCLQSLTHLLKNDKESCVQDEIIDINIDPMLDYLSNKACGEEQKIIHVEAKRYVAGYILNKCRKNIFRNCTICRNIFLDEERDPSTYTYYRDYTKHSLTYAKKEFIQMTTNIYEIITLCLRNSPQDKNLKEKIINYINLDIDFALISCKKHKEFLIQCVTNTAINIVVHSWCKGVNQILKGKIINFDQNDPIKAQAREYYLKKVKNK